MRTFLWLRAEDSSMVDEFFSVSLGYGMILKYICAVLFLLVLLLLLHLLLRLLPILLLYRPAPRQPSPMPSLFLYIYDSSSEGGGPFLGLLCTMPLPE